MKIKKIRYVAAAAVLVVAAAVTVSAVNPDFKQAKNLEILFNLFREITTNYVDEKDPDLLMRKAAEGMLTGFDPYTEFLSENDMEAFELMTTGRYGGIGAVIRKDGDYVEIMEPYEGFAADKAGLKPGDKILYIDGKDMKNAESSTVSALMKGDPGSYFKLTVERFSDGSVVEHNIRRERVSIPGVPYYGMINDSVGYILHDSFTEDCSTDIRNAVVAMKKAGMKQLVYDVRNNGGGILPEAVKIVSIFVPKNSVVVSMKGRAAEVDITYKTTTEPVDTSMNIVVLINNASASAAEIVAGALQDMDRAVVVGQRSFGKGLVQSPRPLGYNTYVKLTTAKYYIPSGRCIQVIDYSYTNEDGSVGAIPDSLIREFHTLKYGRKVYDGGGIVPDVKLPSEVLSFFTISLYAEGFLDEFALEYVKARNFEPVDEKTFRLTEQEYSSFVDFMADKDVDMGSETKLLLDKLEKASGGEVYAEAISPQIAAIREKIDRSRDAELLAKRGEITRLLENMIIKYFHYSQGVIIHNLIQDESIVEAVKVAQDTSRYMEIITTVDTSRN